MRITNKVFGQCYCGGELEWVSPGGQIHSTEYKPESVHIQIASEINGRETKCSKCGLFWTINLPENYPKLVKMDLISSEKSDWEGIVGPIFLEKKK